MTKITAENELDLATLNTLRTQYKTLETTEKHKIAALVRERLSAERQQIEALAAKLYESGVPVRRIGTAYGSSNHLTVLEVIEAGKIVGNVTATVAPEKSDLTPTVTAVPNTIANKPGWEVTLPDGAKLEVYRSGSGTLMPIGPNKARWAENPELVDLLENLS